MAITVKSKKVSIDIVNEKGEMLAKAVFNPKDIGAYNSLMQIARSVDAIAKESKGIKGIQLPDTKEMETSEDFGKLLEPIEAVTKFAEATVAEIDKIATMINKSFGEGVSEALLQGGYDIDPIADFIAEVTPYFTEAKEERVGKYLDNKEGGVM